MKHRLSSGSIYKSANFYYLHGTISWLEVVRLWWYWEFGELQVVKLRILSLWDIAEDKCTKKVKRDKGHFTIIWDKHCNVELWKDWHDHVVGTFPKALVTSNQSRANSLCAESPHPLSHVWQLVMRVCCSGIHC
jgi:hypothetical protein